MSLYRLYVDESGTHSYSMSQQADKRYLALTGVAIKQETIETDLQPGMRRLKALMSPDPDEKFTLHREEIIQRSGPYSKLADPAIETKWNQTIFNLIDSLDFMLFTVVIDKIAHKTKYFNPEHPYHYCLEILLEKYVSFLNSVDGKGDVLAEARGKKEDEALRAEYSRFYENGTSYVQDDVMQARLTSKKIKLKPKDSIAGLELADLIVLASKLDVLLISSKAERINSKFMQQLIPRIQSKYYRNKLTGKISGYGKKMI